MMTNKLVLFLSTVLLVGMCARTAHGIGLELPAEIDFTGQKNKAYTDLRGSKIEEDANAGTKVLVNSEGYDVYAAYVRLKGDFSRPIKVTVTAARGDDDDCRLGVMAQMVEGEKVVEGPHVDFAWDVKLKPDEFVEYVFKAKVDEKLRDKGEDLFMLFYRSNKLGTLKIKKIKIDFLETEEKTKATP